MDVLVETMKDSLTVTSRCPGPNIVFTVEQDTEVPASILLEGRGEKLKIVRRLKSEGKLQEAKDLESKIPDPNNIPKVIQKERALMWDLVPECLQSSTPQMIPFPHWAPEYKANIEKILPAIIEYMVRQMLLPHAVFTGDFYLMLHSDRPPNKPSYLSVVREAWSVIRICRCMFAYFKQSDLENNVWVNTVNTATTRCTNSIALQRKAFFYKVTTAKEFDALKKEMENKDYKSPELPPPGVTELPAKVKALGDIYGKFSFDYAISIIRIFEVLLATLSMVNVEEIMRHKMLTPKDQPKESEVDYILKTHLLEEQLALASSLAAPPLNVKNINIEGIKRFPNTYNGALSHYLLFAYLEWMLLPKDHPLLLLK